MSTKSAQTSNHSDKMGELMKWCQNVDELDKEQMLKHTQFIMEILTISQLKSVLFSGLLKYREDIEYSQIFSMQNNLESYDISKDKKQENKSIDNKDLDVNLNEINEEKEMDLENKISWLDLIPNDIILRNVCSCLWMNDIFNFSKCGRRFAIICHTPPAMNNFQLHIKGKDICSEKNYFHIHRTDHHRLLGVKKLSIHALYDREIEIPLIIASFFRELKHVQQLTFIGPMSNINQFAKPSFKELKSITIDESNQNNKTDEESVNYLLWLFGSDDYDEEKNNNANKMQNKFFKNETIYNLERIAFRNCSFSDYLLPYLCELLLPSKINKLSVLKLEPLNLCFGNINERLHFQKLLNDENLIRRSFCNLRAFVAIVEGMDEWNVGYILSCKILSILQFQLECIHIHSSYCTIDSFPFQYLMKDSKFYQNRKQKEILHLKELCISISNEWVLKKICTNLLEDIFLTHVPNKNTGGLQKLCLVFSSFNVANVFVNDSLKIMLRKSSSLKFLQLKIEEVNNKTENQFEAVNSFLRYLLNAFSEIANEPLVERCPSTKSAFVFKLEFGDYYQHLSFSNKLIASFLLAFPNGMWQFKCDDVKLMAFLLDSILKDKTRFCTTNENSFSVRNIHSYEKYVVYDAQWMCYCEDCR